MLSAGHRVLGRRGKLVTAAVEISEGLAARDRTRARTMGPSAVDAEAALTDLVASAGFEILQVVDGTAAYRSFLENRIEALNRAEEALTASEGADAVQAERLKRSAMLRGVDEGLLRRTLVFARKAAEEAD